MPTSRDAYLRLIRSGLQRLYETHEEETESWRQRIEPDSRSFDPPAHMVSAALVEAFLSRHDGDEGLAKKAIERLSDLRQYADMFAEITGDRGSAQIEANLNIFTLPPYCDAYRLVRDHAAMTASQRDLIEGHIAASTKASLHFPEWGAHNRTTLRAWSMAAAARGCPDHPDAADWMQMGRQLAEDSLHRWNVEDGTLYHAVWSHALFHYVDAAEEPDFFRAPTTRYYFDYYLNLICPFGGLADFGDSWWNVNTHLFIACFERGAREYRDPYYRWAADTLFDRMAAAGPADIYMDPIVWIDALEWHDESVPSRAPEWLSREVLEELVGKKVVFRSGWAPDSTFLLLNYKPETDFGYTIREYMKHTIPVEAEKAHHGHSDENSISTVISDGALLLHDGGYREAMTPSGAYRADYYHNRVVVRNEYTREGASLFDFLDDDGRHRPTETLRHDFRVFEEVEFSRTRVTDRATGYRHDRVIAYLKRDEVFVVIDGVTFLREGPFTVSNIYYTHEILSSGPGYFDTRLGDFREFTQNEREVGLLIVYPQQDWHWEGSETVHRHSQDEILLHQTSSGRGVPGRYMVSLSVLMPHRLPSDAAALAGAVAIPEVSRFPQAAALSLKLGDRKITLGVKLDLEGEILWEDVRPRYSWDSGRTVYGDVETDAHFVYTCEEAGELSYAWTEATRLDYGGRNLFSAPDFDFDIQYAGSDVRRAPPKWRAWEASGVEL